MASEKVTLKKALGFWWLFAIGVGAVVGDGVFTLTGYGVASAGPSMVLVYILVGLSQIFLMVSFGELVVWHPTSGGPEVWVRKLVGWDWGATSSLLFSIGWILAGGSTGLAIGAYTHNFLVHLGFHLQPADLWITLLAVGWLSLFAWLNVRGVDVAARTQFILVLFLVGSVVAYAAAVTPHVAAANYRPFMPNGLAGSFSAVPVAVYAFMGASTVLFASEEARDPVDVARVLLWSSVTFVTVYTWALFAAVGTVPHGEVEKFLESLYVTSANRVYGPVFANALNAAAWTAAATCLLMGTIYQPPRDLYNLARSGYGVPSWMGELHRRYRTPFRNIWLVWGLAVILVLWGQAAGQTMIYQLLSYEVVWVWCVSWVLTLRAAFAFRSRCAEEAAALPWKVPLWPLTPLVGAVGIGLCLCALFQDLNRSYGLRVTLVFFTVSVVLVFLVRQFVTLIKPEEPASEEI